MPLNNLINIEFTEAEIAEINKYLDGLEKIIKKNCTAYP